MIQKTGEPKAGCSQPTADRRKEKTGRAAEKEVQRETGMFLEKVLGRWHDEIYKR